MFQYIISSSVFIMTFGSEKKIIAEGKEKLRFLSVPPTFLFIAFHPLMKY